MLIVGAYFDIDLIVTNCECDKFCSSIVISILLLGIWLLVTQHGKKSQHYSFLELHDSRKLIVVIENSYLYINK